MIITPPYIKLNPPLTIGEDLHSNVAWSILSKNNNNTTPHIKVNPPLTIGEDLHSNVAWSIISKNNNNTPHIKINLPPQ